MATSLKDLYRLLSVMQLVLLVLCALSALVARVSSLCFTHLEKVLFRRLKRDVDEDSVDADLGSSSVSMQEEIGERAEPKLEACDLIGRHQGDRDFTSAGDVEHWSQLLVQHALACRGGELEGRGAVGKFYAVRRGRGPGIYCSWIDRHMGFQEYGSRAFSLVWSMRLSYRASVC
jgi:hypothetical protein